MGTEAELVRKPPLTTAFSATECHLTGPAFLCCRSEAFVHGASPFCFAVQYSGSAWHGWSLPVCWILAQHGMGGAWPATFQFYGRGPAGSWSFPRMGQRAVQEDKIAWEKK